MRKQRLDQVCSYISAQGAVTSQELAEHFSVSSMTIRRDLDILAQQGRIQRYHGGAKPAEQTIAEASFDARSRTNYSLKAAIGREAARFLNDRLAGSTPSSVFIGSGSTVFAMAKQLVPHVSVPIVTDNPYTAGILAAHRDNTVIMVSGQLAGPSLSAIGYLAEQCLSDFSLDYAFIGSSAIDENGNLYAYNMTEVGIFSKLISVAKHVVVLADHSKLGKRNLIHIRQLGPRFTLITDSDAGAACVARYRELGAQVIVANI